MKIKVSDRAMFVIAWISIGYSISGILGYLYVVFTHINW